MPEDGQLIRDSLVSAITKKLAINKGFEKTARNTFKARSTRHCWKGLCACWDSGTGFSVNTAASGRPNGMPLGWS